MRNKSSGFALIEVIVSIVILSLVLASAVGLLYSVSVAVEKNRDRLTATYLAQECLELARNARDTSWRNHQPWDCAWTGSDSEDCVGKNILNSAQGNPVKINGKSTKFSRDFEIGELDSDDNELEVDSSISFAAAITAAPAREEVPEEETITCTVKWGGNDKISISEILTNWRKF